MTPKLIILIGPQGSGKSTWVNRYRGTAERTPVVASTDDIIEEFAATTGRTYSEAFRDLGAFKANGHEGFKAVRSEMLRRVRAAIAAGHDIINDQTNMSRKSRRTLLSMVPQEYQKLAYVFSVPDDVLERRLAARAATGKAIPIEVVRAKQKEYVAPSKEEGFNEIHWVKQ